ncbi:hypothetical protein ACS0TY_028110 [Phlomoides rotata]
MLLKGMEFDTTHFITDVSGKYPRLWALKGAHPVTVNRWYKFRALASIRTIAPSFREISELPEWVVSDKSWSLHKEKPGPVKENRYALSQPCLERCGKTKRRRPLHEEKRDGPPHFTEKLMKTHLHSSPIRRAQNPEERVSKIERSKNIESTYLSSSSSPLYNRVENELRLCWVLLKEFRTTVSPAAVV